MGLDLYGREACGVPSSAKRLHKKNGGNETLALDDGGLLFAVEDVFLSTDHVEITDQAAYVTGSGDVELATRRGDSGILRHARFVEYLQTGDVVLNFAEELKRLTAAAKSK